MALRDKPVAPASPWQNGFAERLISSIRRECVDHLSILGEAHLRRGEPILVMTTTSERTGHKIRMRRSIVPFSVTGIVIGHASGLHQHYIRV
jgi:hypothetical protein